MVVVPALKTEERGWSRAGSGVGAEEEVCAGLEREGQSQGRRGPSKDCDFLLGVKKPLEVSKQSVDMILHSF